MPSLDTTNLILAVIAAAAVGQLALVTLVTLSLARQVALLREAFSRFEAVHLPGLGGKVNDLVDDLHRVAERIDRVGREVERTTHVAQGVLGRAGSEVERATRGVRAALDLVEGGIRQAARIRSAVLGPGVRELFSWSRSHRRREQVFDADAIARFEAGA